MKKKLLSILFVLAMCLTLLPTAAFADETGGAPETGETCTHTDDSGDYTVNEKTGKCAECGYQFMVQTNLDAFPWLASIDEVPFGGDLADIVLYGDTGSGKTLSLNGYPQYRQVTISLGGHTLKSNINATTASGLPDGLYIDSYDESDEVTSGTFDGTIRYTIDGNAILNICDGVTVTGKVTIDGGDGYSGRVDLYEGATLAGGIETTVSGGTLRDFLDDPTGTAYAKKDAAGNYTVLVDGNVTSITEAVRVIAHPTHTFTAASNYTSCECGFNCSHTANKKTGICTECGYQFAVQTSDAWYKSIDDVSFGGDLFDIRLYGDTGSGKTLSLNGYPNDRYLAIRLRGHTLKSNINATTASGLPVELYIACYDDYDGDGDVTSGTFDGTIRYITNDNKSLSIFDGVTVTGKVTINGTNLTGKVFLYEGATLAGGIETTISGGTLRDFLDNPTGTAYAKKDAAGNYTVLVDGNVTSITEAVRVVAHTSHTYDSATGKCGCGAACPHETANDETGKCAECGYQFAVLAVNTWYKSIDDVSFGGDLFDIVLYGDTGSGKTLSLNGYPGDAQLAISLRGHTLKSNINATTASGLPNGLNIVSYDGSDGDGDVTSSTFDGTIRYTTNGDKFLSILDGVTVTGKVTIDGGDGHSGRAYLYEGATLAGGIETTISGGTLRDFLGNKTGTAYAKKDAAGNYTVLVDGGVTSITEAVRVIAHKSHTYDSATGKCGCGAACPHTNVGTDGICEACGYQSPVCLLRADGETYEGYATVAAALAAAAEEPSCVLTLYADLSEGALSTNGSTTFALNGHKLTANITTGGTATFENGTVDGTITASVGSSLCFREKVGVNGKVTVSAGASIAAGTLLAGGIEISSAGRTLMDILPDGMAFAAQGDAAYDVVVSAAATSITDSVMLIPHTAHTALSDSTHCVCGRAVAAKLSDINNTEGFTAYYTTIGDALAALNAWEHGTAILTVLADGSIPAGTTVTRAGYLILNGKTVTGDLTIDMSAGNYSLVVRGTPGGKLDGTVTVRSGGLIFNRAADATIKEVVVERAGAEVSTGTNAGTITALTVKGGSASLTAGTFGTITVNADGKKVGDLLEKGYGIKLADGAWLDQTATQTTLTGVTVQALPVLLTSLGGETRLTYGDPLTVTANIDPEGAEGVQYEWLVNGTPVAGETGASYAAGVLNAGTYTVTCKATLDGYTSTASKTLTVAKMTLQGEHFTHPKALTDALTYTGSAQTLAAAGSVDGGATIRYSLDKSTWTSTVPTATDVGDYTVYWYVDGGTNYTDFYRDGEPFEIKVSIAKASLTDAAGYRAPTAKSDLEYSEDAQQLIDGAATPSGVTAYYSLDRENWTTDAAALKGTDAGDCTVYWYVDGGTNYASIASRTAPNTLTSHIAPLELRVVSVRAESKDYDGTDAATVTFAFERVKTGAGYDLESGYTVEARFPGADATDGDVPVAVKITLTNENYTFANGAKTCEPVDCSAKIRKAAAPTASAGSLTVYNGIAGQYSFDFSSLLPTLADGLSYGTVIYNEPAESGITYVKENYFDRLSFTTSGGNNGQNLLTAAIRAVDSTAEGELATVKVTASSDNYESVELALVIRAANAAARVTVGTGESAVSTCYATFAEALAAANAAEAGKAVTLTLQKTEATDSAASLALTRDMTLDLARSTLTAANGLSVARGSIVTLTGVGGACALRGGLTVENGGKLTANGITADTLTVSAGGEATLGDACRFAKLTNQNSGKTVSNLLAAGYGYEQSPAQDGQYLWVLEAGAELSGTAQYPIRTAKLPFTGVTLATTAGSAVYGAAQPSLSASLTGADGSSVTYAWYIAESADAVFSASAESASGNALTFPAKDAGTYYIGCTAAERNYALRSNVVTITVTPAATSLTVSLAGWTFGETAKTPDVRGNAGGGALSITYKAQDAADETYTATVPTGAGDYVVRAVAAATTNYTEGAATARFTIAKAAAPRLTDAACSLVYTETTGTVDLASLDAPADAGALTYALGTLPVGVESARVDGTTLSFTLASGGKAGDTFTLPLTVRSENYADAAASAVITLAAKSDRALTVTMSGWTFGGTASEPRYDKPADAQSLRVAYKVKGAADETYTAAVPTGAGEYTVRVSYETATEIWSGSADFTIAAARLTGVSVRQSGALTYSGSAQTAQVETEATALGGESVRFTYSMSENGVYGAMPQLTDADSYTVYYEADAANHVTARGSFTVTIAKATPSVTNATAAVTYGQRVSDSDITAETGGVAGSFRWKDVSSYGDASDGAKTLYARFVPADSKNYETLASVAVSVTVAKAVYTGDAIEAAASVFVGQTRRGVIVDLSDLLRSIAGAAVDGAAEDSDTDPYDLVENVEVLAANRVRFDLNGGEGAHEGVIEVNVSSTNYQGITARIVVTSVAKNDVGARVSFTGGTLTYTGSALTYERASISGLADGSWTYTYAATSDTASLSDGKPLTAGSYTVTAFYEDAENYAEVSVTLTVAKATPTGEPRYTAITTSGKTLADAALAADGFSTAGTIGWVDADGAPLAPETEVTANTSYLWRFTPDDTANYEALTGSIRLWSRSSSSGGSTSITVPVSSDGGSVKVDASVSGSTARVSVSDKQLDAVAADGAGSVTVDVSGLKRVTSAVIPAEIVEKTDAADDTGLTVALPSGSVSLDESALASVTADAKGEDVTVSVVSVPTAKLPTAVKNAVGMDATVVAVVDVNVTVGGAKLSAFRGGKLTISIPYTPKEGEDTSRLAVWFVRDDGTIENKGGWYDAARGCFVFETEHLSQYLLVYGGAAFADVPADAYYASAVSWAVAQGITNGVDDSRFAPDLGCTRAQIVTFLYRAAGSPAVEVSGAFEDVAADAYYAKAVAWAVAQGITTGTSAARFSPDETCTRAQAVAFLFRYAAANGMSAVTMQELVSGYGDAGSVPGYALPAFNWALARGIVQGANGNLMPNDTCTRAQIVTLLQRTMG